MLRAILVWGVIGGLIVGTATFGFTVAYNGHEPPHGLLLGYLTMLVALTAVFVGIKRYRDVERGGVISFWQALVLGLAISVVASLFYVAAWEAALHVLHFDFAAAYANAMIARAKASGVSGEKLARLTAEMATFKANYANPLYRLPETFTEIFPVGVLVSLVSAGLLCNSRFLPARRG